MKLVRLWVKDYKNLRDSVIEFPQPHLLNAIIGNNGSGKSNIIEAILHILIGVYFKKAPPFDFVFEFEAQSRKVVLKGEGQALSVQVDDEKKPLEFFAGCLRDGSSQVYYPELTLVYYSGECQRVHRLIAKYRSHFERLTSEPESDRKSPLFIHSTSAQARVILLALFAHQHLTHRHRGLTERLGLMGVVDVRLKLRSPEGFNPERHEPKLWNTVGAVRRIVAAIDETAAFKESRRFYPRTDQSAEESLTYIEHRTYRFSDDLQSENGLTSLAARLAKGGDNVYLALEHLRARGMLLSVSFQVVGLVGNKPFEFDQLSEGEKQLLAVVGVLQLTNRQENLVLLDEPDTHLNPHWSWEYPSMLTEAFDLEKQRRSTVLIATHTPIMISGMTSDQVLLAHKPSHDKPAFTRPRRHPRGQGIANLLCSSEFFGLPSSLDKETQKLLDERLSISVKEVLADADKARLKVLNAQLEILLSPGISERDPAFVKFLRRRHSID